MPDDSRPSSAALLDSVADATGGLDLVVTVKPGRAGPLADPRRLEAFHAESDEAAALRVWLAGRHVGSVRDLRAMLCRDIASLDRVIAEQVNRVLHAPAFQRLEAAWRGLQYLVREANPDRESVRVVVLHATWREIVRDLDSAAEFDQSVLFQRIYTDEFGVLGGEPFGLLLGDYSIHPLPSRDHPFDDVGTLRRIAEVAAAAFAPFVAAAHPTLLGLSSFSELSRRMDLHVNFENPEFIKWKSLRAADESRFISLLLPRVLMRAPYRSDGSRNDGFIFEEDVTLPNAGSYLWGSPVYAFGATCVRAYRDCGWFADIKGVRRGEEGGGIIKSLLALDHGTDASRVATKPATEVIVTEDVERDLATLGFICVCPCKDTEFAAFLSSQSIQAPLNYNVPEAAANARLSAMTSYMLCVSQISHHLKVMARHKAGSFIEPREFEGMLNKWLSRFVAEGSNSTAQMRALYPLRGGEVKVREAPGRPGSFVCEMHLEPHYQFEEMTTQTTFRTIIQAGASN